MHLETAKNQRVISSKKKKKKKKGGKKIVEQSMGSALYIGHFKEGHKHMVSCGKFAMSCASRQPVLLTAVMDSGEAQVIVH